MSGLQRRQEGRTGTVTVIIRKQGFGAYAWTCTTLVSKPGGGTGPCSHMDVAESEKAAHQEYEKHKKTTRGH